MVMHGGVVSSGNAWRRCGLVVMHGGVVSSGNAWRGCGL